MSASLNVFVNTKALADRAYAESLEQEADQLLATYAPRADALASLVARRIRGEE